MAQNVKYVQFKATDMYRNFRNMCLYLRLNILVVVVVAEGKIWLEKCDYYYCNYNGICMITCAPIIVINILDDG